MSNVHLDRDDLDKWDIDSLRSLKVELHWALQAKENQQKIPVWQIEGYSGVTHAYLSFDNALDYVKANIEKDYREGFKNFVEEGCPTYIKLQGYASRIVPIMMLPEDLKLQDKYFIRDLDWEKSV